MKPVPEYVNVPIWELPIYTGCYKECKVSFFHFSNGTSTYTVISPEEAAFIRNLYQKHRQEGMKLPEQDLGLENKIRSLVNKNLVVTMMKKVHLTKTAYDSDYTFLPFPQS